MLQQRLKHIRSMLKDWNKKEFGNIFKAKREAEQKLQEINQIIISEGFTEERKIQVDSLQNKWEDRWMQEEIFWRQKSRVQWIREGERNTKFFQRSTLDHRSHNRISKLKDSQRKELVSHKEMEFVLFQYFLSIAEEPLVNRTRFINKFPKSIPKFATREDNHNLNRRVSEEEVSEVINEMQNGKALGLDGFNVDFFKACWKTVK